MRRSLPFAFAAAALSLQAPAALAQGSAVMTHSSCATAMGAAGVANPCEDGSAVLFNPAALALQPSVLGIGWTGINTSGSFEFDAASGGGRFERDAMTSSVPFAFASYRFRDNLAAAIGVFAPYGLGVLWEDDDDITFPGRFVSYDTDLSNIYVQPTLSFAPSERFSVGAGVDVVFSSIDINQRVGLAGITAAPGVTFGNLGVAQGTDFADANLAGDGTSVTFHLGALARLSDRLSVGARYLHGADVEFEGDADFTQVNTGLVLAPNNPLGAPAGTPVDALLAAQFTGTNPLADQTITTSLPLPAQAVVGVSFMLTPDWKLLGDYQWTNWETWDETEIVFANQTTPTPLVLNYQNTHTWRAGTEFVAGEVLTLRGGFIYNTAAQTEFAVSPLLPEAERNYYSLGLGYNVRPGLSIDAGYQLVDQSDRRGRVSGLLPGLTDEHARALNVGVYDSEAHVFNVTLSYQFGARR